MKKLALLLTMIALPLFAEIEVTPFGGIQWNGSGDFNWTEYDKDADPSYTAHWGTFDIEHNGNFGVFINADLPARMGAQLELHWTGNKSVAHWRSNSDNFPSGDYDVYINTWQIGGLKYFAPESKKLRPFVNGGLGVTAFLFDDDYTYGDERLNNQAFFSTSIGIGAKVEITEKIGIRVGSRFLIPINFDGVGFSFGTGGTSAGAYGYVPVLMGDLHGGLVIKFGGKKQPAKKAPAAKPAPAPKPAEPATRIEEVSPTEVHIINE